jgi:hypothetical protein
MKKLFAIVMVALLCSCQPKTVQKNGGVIIDVEIGDSQTSPADVSKTVDLIKKRVELFCKTNPLITVNSRNLHIEMPLIMDTLVCKTILFQKGEFEIMESYEAQDVLPFLAEINKKLVENKNYDLKFPSDSTMIKDNPLFNLISINETREENGIKKLQKGPAVGFVKESDTALLNAVFNHKELSKLLPRNLIFKWAKERNSKEISLFILIATKTRGITPEKLITSDMIMDSKIDDRGGRPEIMFTLKPEFHKRWKRITQENVDLSLPMLIDNFVISYPTVFNEIKEGKSSISGNYEKEEANAIVALLKFGISPAKITVKKIVSKEKN